MAGPLRPVLPPHVVEAIRALPPEIKRHVREAIRALCLEPRLGQPLRGELTGLWKYRVRRYRIVYRVVASVLQVHAVGHRRDIYERTARQRRSG